MRVHLTGVCGTGMGSLALLFREAGHDVSGSDLRFDPPMGDVLRGGGVTLLPGYEEAHLAGRPDLVVIGNAIRRDNVEAVAAEAMDLRRVSMSAALREHFLAGRRPLVVCGTHGKTTTSAMCAWILSRAGQEPGYFIGGVTKNFPQSASNGAVRRKLASSREPPPGSRSPFVVEGDEYDAVYWNKQPKFLDYVGVADDDVAIVTSVEHDHIDIYPDVQAYNAAFRALARAMPKDGLVVCDGHDARAAACMQTASARVSYYALEGDDLGDRPPHWLSAPATVDESGMLGFDLFAGGVSCGRFALPMPGMHNLRNATAAIAACAEGFGVSMAAARAALVGFKGVRRRQELIGEPDGVRVYDDFAHHPTAVDETLRALRARHPSGALWAIFEPRSATACRSIHQHAYVTAFGVADRVLLAPLGRSNVPEGERLDTRRLAADLGARASAVGSVEAIVELVRDGAEPGDILAILSNGPFGGLHGRILDALATRPPRLPA